MNKYQEALDFLCDHAMEYIADFDWEENDCGEYYPLDKETLNANKSVLQELIDKAAPKEPDLNDFIVLCPNCGTILCDAFEAYGEDGSNERHYCHCCGQALDWSDDQ